jgi:lysophospholipase L1-like esterase
MNKVMVIIGILILTATAYLFASHKYIYYTIGKAKLPMSDYQHEYGLGATDSASTTVYTALGDSLTAGVGVSDYRESYPYLIAQKMSARRSVTLLDFAYPGARTDDLIRDLLDPTIAQNPDIITVLIGVNDLHGFVSEKVFAANYELIIRRLSEETNAEIFTVGLPRLGPDSLLLPPWRNYFDRQRAAYESHIEAITKKYGAGYIDLNTPTAEIFRQSGPHYSSDSFHPSAAGYGLWADIIYAAVDR